MCFAKQGGEEVELQPIPHTTGHGGGNQRGRGRGGRAGSSRPAAATGQGTVSSAAGPSVPVQPPVIANHVMSGETVDEAIRLMAWALINDEYAFIGGVAVGLLGSRRGTKDIDLLVPNGQAGSVAMALHTTGRFGIERQQNGRYRVWFNASNRQHYNVDIMEPRDIHQQFPSSSSGRMQARGGYVLSPALLLNYKCFSWQIRKDTSKKSNDAQDIQFLLSYMMRNREEVSAEEMTNATDDFFYEFFGSYPDTRGQFAAIGLRVP